MCSFKNYSSIIGIHLPDSHLGDKRESLSGNEWTQTQKVFANCPPGDMKEFLFWTEVHRSLPKQLGDFLNDISNKINSHV